MSRGECAVCGEVHEHLEPAYRRPDEVIALPAEERAARVEESDDLCVLEPTGPRAKRARYFVRCVLPVELRERKHTIDWAIGLWVEVSGPSFARILELWDDPDQAGERAMRAKLANNFPGYPPTIGLPVSLRHRGPGTRPVVSFGPAVEHPFAAMARAGMTAHRAAKWMERFR